MNNFVISSKEDVILSFALTSLYKTINDNRVGKCRSLPPKKKKNAHIMYPGTQPRSIVLGAQYETAALSRLLLFLRIQHEILTSLRDP